MAEPTYLPTFDVDVENISALSNLPNEDDGLTAEELKAAFDKAAVDIKNYINTVMLEAIEDAIANKAAGGDPRGISGATILDGTITTMKLSSAAGQEAVTGAVIRDGTISASKLTSDIRGTIAALPGQISDWTQEMVDFGTTIGNLSDNVSTLNTTTGTHTQQITSLQGADTTINGRIDTLANEVHGATGTGGIQGSISTLQSADTTINGRIDTLAAEVHGSDGTGGIQGSITTLQSEDVGIKTRLTTAEGKITTLENNYTTLSGQLTTVSGKANANEGNISTLQSQMTTANSNITALQSGKQAQHKFREVTLTAGGQLDGSYYKWVVSVSGVTASNTVLASPADDTAYTVWRNYGVRLAGQSAGYLTFHADAQTPTACVVHVVILD